jgi:hypothetical protein
MGTSISFVAHSYPVSFKFSALRKEFSFRPESERSDGIVESLP